MNWATRVLIFMAGGFCGAAGCGVLMALGNESLVDITVLNQSQQTVAAAVITDQVGRAYHVPSCEPGAEHVVHLYARGTSYFTVEAVMQDGSVLTSRPEAVEPGYRVEARVLPASIEVVVTDYAPLLGGRD